MVFEVLPQVSKIILGGEPDFQANDEVTIFCDDRCLSLSRGQEDLTIASVAKAQIADG